MTISEVAKRSGLSTDTVRYYEKQGLLNSYISRRGNNYRHYDEAVIERLLLIKQTKLAGFTLSEIQVLFEKWSNNTLSQEDIESIILSKLEAIENRITELQQIRDYLKKKLESNSVKSDLHQAKND